MLGFQSPLEPSSLTMTSQTRSFSLLKHTPVLENEQNEREIMQLRLLAKPNARFALTYFPRILLTSICQIFLMNIVSTTFWFETWEKKWRIMKLWLKKLLPHKNFNDKLTCFVTKQNVFYLGILEKCRLTRFCETKLSDQLIDIRQELNQRCLNRKTIEVMAWIRDQNFIIPLRAKWVGR